VALQLPEVRDPLMNDTIDITPSASPRAFAAFLAAETAKWGTLVKETGAKAE
jgi:tripartite-type tricarboxylate transporter receptor subunit TctC